MARSPQVAYRVEEPNVALLAAAGRPLRVLDVGAGIGQNGRVLRGRGAHVTGLERHPASRARAAQVLDEVVDCDIESSDELARCLGGRRFDCILLGDVLEHTRDPEAVLAALTAFLAPEGRLVVSLPNVAAWNVRLGLLFGKFEYQDSGILDRTHLRFFTRNSAMQLGERLGLELLSVDHNPMGIRALRDSIAKLARGGVFGRVDPADPTALSRSLPYVLYQALLRPIEHQLTRLSPELLAFQHVLVWRLPTRPRKLSLTVGLLTMNEESSIEPMIDAIRQHAPSAQILVVDSSSDSTPERARQRGAKVLRQVPARGHGPAMELLMTEASRQSDALIYLDCDFTYPPRFIPELLRMLEQGCADVVNGARTREKPSAMPWPNFLANRTFALIAQKLVGVPTVDLHSGMRAYRSSVIRAFSFDGEGDALPVDTLLLPALAGFRVLECGIAYDERVGDSKLRKVSGTLWTFLRLLGSLGHPRRPSRFEVQP